MLKETPFTGSPVVLVNVTVAFCEDDSENDSQDDIEDDSEDESEDDSKNDSRGSFVDFIDRVLAVSGNFPIKKFAISCDIGFRTDRWIRDVLNRGGVLDIDLRLGIDDAHLPSEIFTCKTLVELKLTGFCIKELPEDTFLPAFKKLVLKSVQFTMSLLHIIPKKLLSACPVLEELVIDGLLSYRSVSSRSLRKLTIRHTEFDGFDGSDLLT